MAFTDGISVSVGDATKASIINNLADNTEWLRDKANAEHDFDISTGDGTHKDVNADSLTSNPANSSTLGLLIRNETFAAGPALDGMQFWVGNSGDSNIRAYEQSATTYYDMNFSADTFVFNAFETGNNAMRVINNQTNSSISLEASGTTASGYVGVRATADQLKLIGDGAVVATIDSAEFTYSPSGDKLQVGWDGTGIEMTLNGTEKFGGTSVLAIESRKANHAAFTLGGFGLTGATGRLVTLVDTSSGGNRYGDVRSYINGSEAAQLSGALTGLTLHDHDHGTSGGRRAVIGRNDNATTPAAGTLVLTRKDGNLRYLWVDNSDDPRIHSSAPTSSTDTSGRYLLAMAASPTESLQFTDAGSTSATEQDWIEVTVGGNTGYIRVFSSK